LRDKILGIDVSRWQGTIDFEKLVAHPVKFCGVRVSISWAYVDNQAERNLNECLNRGIAPLPYWVLYPNEDPQRQVDHFLNTLTKWHFDIAKINTVVDVELGEGNHSCTANHFQSVLSSALAYSTAQTENFPIIYSRASFINHYITGAFRTPPAWYDNYDWWLAQYLRSGLEHQGPPTLPRGVERDLVIIHQTSDRAGGGSGYDYGMQSAGLDFNRWQLSDEAFDSYFNFGQTEPIEPPTDCEELRAENEYMTAQIAAVKAIVNEWRL